MDSLKNKKEKLQGYNFNGFFLDVINKNLSYKGIKKKLGNYDYEVLLCLIEKNPNLARKIDIKSKIESETGKELRIDHFQTVLHKSSSRLRELFRSTKDAHKGDIELHSLILETLPNEGYRLHAHIEKRFINSSIVENLFEIPLPNEEVLKEETSDNEETLNEETLNEESETISNQSNQPQSQTEIETVPIKEENTDSENAKNQTEQTNSLPENETINPQNSFKKWFDKLKKQFLANQFNSWLFDKNNSLAISVLIIVSLAILAIILLSVFQNPTSEQPAKLKYLVSGIQGCIILLAISYKIKGIKEFNSYYKNEVGFNTLSEKKKKSLGYTEFDKWDLTSKIAEKVWTDYKNYWRFVLFFWLLLYAFLTLRGYNFPDSSAKIDFSKAAHTFEILLNIIITGLNYLASLAFFLCFNILNSPTNFGKEDETIEDNTLGKGIVFIVLIIGFEIIYLSFQQEITTDHWQFFDVMSGITAGVCMSLLFARLQSKFQSPPSWLIVMLFIYTSIQSLFHYLNETPWAIPIMLLALFFKSLLFLYMNFLFQTGRLLFYLIKVRKTYENIEDEFEDVKSLFK